MKRALYIIISLTIFMFPIFGQNRNDCQKGDQDQQKSEKPNRELADSAAATMATSLDPNELLGPAGYDSLRWVSINDVLHYTIFFENDDEFATASAQVVDIRFKFPAYDMMRNFRLGEYNFALQSFDAGVGGNACKTRLDLRDSMHIYVDLLAGFDIEQEVAFWHFSSIDPETGYAPWQIDRGMLPVNDSTHVGEGYVTFTMKPSADMQTGDSIYFNAKILFDQNDTIPTNYWCNYVDAGAPTSTVLAVQDSLNSLLYHLSFTASDDIGGTGVKHVILYAMDYTGTYQEVAAYPVDTVIDFALEHGMSLNLVTVAVDMVGNRELFKPAPDVVLNANLPPIDLLLSDTLFRDDLAQGGFIATLSTLDNEEGEYFEYALAEGDGAIHNDYFVVEGNQLRLKESLECATDSIYHLRLSTTDVGGLTYTKAVTLNMDHVLIHPDADTTYITICEGENCVFRGETYSDAGTFVQLSENAFMCDSTHVLQLVVLPQPEMPTISVDSTHTLVSSALKGNQWFFEDGTPVAGATQQSFTPTEDGIYYVATTNGSCYSEPSAAYQVQVSDKCQLKLDLEEGWNWISSNLSDTHYQKAIDFFQPIQQYVERLVGFDAELIRDPNLGLAGNLNTLSPSESYLLLTNAIVENDWAGIAYKPEVTAIHLKKGWNWIGYIPVAGNSLENALSYFKPMEGDVIKNYNDFATYNNGKWTGSLGAMNPGIGYMYYSNREISFNYPAIRVFPVVNPNNGNQQVAYNESVPWQVNRHAYPYNMTMIANLYVNGNNMPAGLYTIGAFVGDECRGIGKYIDNKLFMTIYGDVSKSEYISFKAYHNTTNREYTIVENVAFENTIVGTINEPFILTIGGATNTNQVITTAYNIYPNPVRDVLYISGNVNAITKVVVLTDNGITVAQTTSYTTAGINVSNLLPGSYIVVIETISGMDVKKMIKLNASR